MLLEKDEENHSVALYSARIERIKQQLAPLSP